MAESARDDDVEELREQDRFLPIANINRIVKRRLPYNAKVAKEAKETTQVRKVHQLSSNYSAHERFRYGTLLFHTAPSRVCRESRCNCRESGIIQQLIVGNRNYTSHASTPLIFSVVWIGTRPTPTTSMLMQGRNPHGMSTLFLSHAFCRVYPAPNACCPPHMRGCTTLCTLCMQPDSEDSFRGWIFSCGLGGFDEFLKTCAPRGFPPLLRRREIYPREGHRGDWTANTQKITPISLFLC